MAAFWKILPGIPSSSHRSERGAALFIILMVVVLYAALSYAVAKTTSGGSGPEREVRMISAGAIQQNMNGRIAEFNRLMIRGCSPNEIYPFPYTTAQAQAAGLGVGNIPVTSGCVIHNTVGGDLPPGLPDPKAMKVYSSTGYTEEQIKMLLSFSFDAIYQDNFPGIGTVASDLYFITLVDFMDAGGSPDAMIASCNQINRASGIDFTITSANYNTFAASFVLNPFHYNMQLYNFQTSPPLNIPTEFHGHNSGCLIFPSGSAVYYQIAYER